MNTKKQTLFVMLGVMVVTLACSLGVGVPVPTQTSQPQGDQVDEVATAVQATMQVLTATAAANIPTQTEPPAQPSGIPVTLQDVSFVIPDGLATGATPEAVSAVGEDNGAPWDVAPAYLRFTLNGYQLQNKFHEPRLFFYPASEYAAVNPGAADQIKITANAIAGGPLQLETLPVIPFFNAGPLMAANIQLMKFQSGMGVRSVTQYAQYSAPINNRELFYHFQGLTADNQYYIIAILPITAPVLPENEQSDTPVPANGVPYPGETADQTYYFSVTEKLNALSPDAYTPTLNKLDQLIESILVTKP